MSTRRIKDGIVEMEKAVAMNPANADFYADLAEMQEMLPESRLAARRNLDIALELEPYNPVYLVSRSGYLLDDGKFDAAKRDLDKALFFGAYDDGVHNGLRKYYWRIGDMASAVKEAEKMVELVPGNLQNLHTYGFTLYQNRDCRAQPVLQAYLEACAESKTCRKHETDGVGMLIQSLKHSCN